MHRARACMLKLAHGTQHEKSSDCATATLIKREITPCYANGLHIRVLVGGRQRRQGVVCELLTLHHLLSRGVERVDGAFGRPDHSRQSREEKSAGVSGRLAHTLGQSSMTELTAV